MGIISRPIYGLDDVPDVSVPSPSTDHVLKWNGSAWVSAAYNASFAFAISSFSDGQSSPQLMGPAGTTWKAIGALTFSASYSNGPPAWAYISKNAPGWNDPLDFSAPFTSVANLEAVNYPANPGDTITFGMLAYKDGVSDISEHPVAFYNYIYYGVLSKASGFTESDIESLTPGSSPELSNTKSRTITVAPGSGEYIIYALPVRLGTVTFTVGGFTGGFSAPETVSITNSAGYTEDYYVYASENANLGSTTVVVA